jgi:hypothetical protein
MFRLQTWSCSGALLRLFSFLVVVMYTRSFTVCKISSSLLVNLCVSRLGQGSYFSACRCALECREGASCLALCGVCSFARSDERIWEFMLDQQ